MARPPDRVAAWRAVLLSQNRTLRAIERDLAAAGTIPISWYDVLLELQAAQPDGLRMQDLGAKVVLSRTRVSRLVAELEEAGLVERVADPGDGRATIARITPAGRTAFRTAVPIYLGGIEEHFTRHLTAQEQRVIADALQRVVDANEGATRERRARAH